MWCPKCSKLTHCSFAHIIHMLDLLGHTLHITQCSGEGNLARASKYLHPTLVHHNYALSRSSSPSEDLHSPKSSLWPIFVIQHSSNLYPIFVIQYSSNLYPPMFIWFVSNIHHHHHPPDRDCACNHLYGDQLYNGHQFWRLHQDLQVPSPCWSSIVMRKLCHLMMECKGGRGANKDR